MLTAWIHDGVSLLAVINPLGNIPVFLAITDGLSPQNRRKTAQRALFIALAIGLGFTVIGQPLFRLFGITLNAFRIAGGIILFGIAYRLLNAEPSNIHTPQTAEQEQMRHLSDIAITPLATPLIAGPGTLATLLVLEGTTRGGGHLAHLSLVALAFTGVIAINYAVLTHADTISHRLSRSALNAITRMMGLLLSVIAVQMVVDGLMVLFPGLAASFS
jgi:multiple antibiotic resistance protein